MKKVKFYTKLNCHLCLDAYRMLLDLACDMPLEIDVIDISHSHNAEINASYAERIPVVTTPGAGTELGWPFTPHYTSTSKKSLNIYLVRRNLIDYGLIRPVTTFSTVKIKIFTTVIIIITHKKLSPMIGIMSRDYFKKNELLKKNQRQGSVTKIIYR